MIKLIWDTMQVPNIDDQADLGPDAIDWYIWSSLFPTWCKLLIFLIKVICDTMLVVDIYDQGYLRLNASCWYIW